MDIAEYDAKTSARLEKWLTEQGYLKDGVTSDWHGQSRIVTFYQGEHQVMAMADELGGGRFYIRYYGQRKRFTPEDLRHAFDDLRHNS